MDEAKKLSKTDWFDSISIVPKLGSVSALVPELIRLKTGEIGIWKRNPVMGYVIYRLNDTKKPEIKTFEESKDDVMAALSIQEAESIAIEKAKEYLSKLEDGALIGELIEEKRLKLETIELTANSKFLPKIGNNKEFLKVGLKLNDSLKYGLSISDNRAYLIYFKNRALDNGNAVNLKKKIRSELLQNMEQALIRKELKRLRDSATIEIKNPMLISQGSS